MNSKRKGKEGELQLAKELRLLGYDARRSQQFAGINGDADLVGLPKVHIECKRTERLNIYDAYAQSRHDARPGEIPVVMHKKNRHEWMVTLNLVDFIDIYKEWEAGNDTANDGAGASEKARINNTAGSTEQIRDISVIMPRLAASEEGL